MHCQVQVASVLAMEARRAGRTNDRRFGGNTLFISRLILEGV